MNGIHFDLKERTDMDFSFLKKVLLEDATPHQQMDLSSDGEESKQSLLINEEDLQSQYKEILTSSKFFQKLYQSGRIRELGSNFVIPCPWCEVGEINKNHYHLYIDKEKPIYHCFRCDSAGTLDKLVRKILGNDCIDEITRIREFVNRTGEFFRVNSDKLSSNADKVLSEFATNILVQKIDAKLVSNNLEKSMYLWRRLNLPPEAFTPDNAARVFHSFVPGVILDVDMFLYQNRDFLLSNYSSLEWDELTQKAQAYRNDYIFFVTYKKTKLVGRNTRVQENDKNSSVRYRSFSLLPREVKNMDGTKYPVLFDYYLATKPRRNSSSLPVIVLCEGVFDALITSVYLRHSLEYRQMFYNEFIRKTFVPARNKVFEFTPLTPSADIEKNFIIASALSTSYSNLIKSIFFDFSICVHPQVIILSDHGVDLSFYQNLSQGFLNVGSFKVSYNANSKDFASGNVSFQTHTIVPRV
jgi:hypothetical protein